MTPGFQFRIVKGHNARLGINRGGVSARLAFGKRGDETV